MQNRELDDSEMTLVQLNYLDELIIKFQPSKLVEIGIAAGGTSVHILNTLRNNACNTSMYSLDISVNYYKDNAKRSGFLINEYFEDASAKTSLDNEGGYFEENTLGTVIHKMYLGKFSPEILPYIGSDIDMLILDTVHSMPGEFLDFLAFLPYLSQNAVVVVHDIILNHLSYNYNGYCTQLLINSAVGNALTPIDIKKPYPGIGAIQINQDTHKYIGNVFNALTITWDYMPSDGEIMLYRSLYEKHYSAEHMFIFDEAVRMNRETLKRKKEELSAANRFKALCDFARLFVGKKTYIYGRGTFGKKYESILDAYGITIEKFIVTQMSDSSNSTVSLKEYKDNYYDSQNDIVLVGVNYENIRGIEIELVKHGIMNYYIPEDEVLRILQS